VAQLPTCNEVNGWLDSDISGGLLSGQRFDHDFFRKLPADAKARMANLADDMRLGVLADQADFLLLAKAHFAKAIGNFR
jgi:hypothetical protein